MNLIVTCPRNLEDETREEITRILGVEGDDNPEVIMTKISGILTVNTSVDTIDFIKKVRSSIIDEPWGIRYISRIIPIQNVVDTKIDEIKKSIENISYKINPDEKYMIQIEKRNSNISSQEIISSIAKIFTNKVSLEYPDKIVLIEILGSKTGISIIRKSDVLSIEKTKRDLWE